MATKKPNYLKLTPEEQAKVQKARAKSEATKILVDREDFVMVEIVYYLGWDALRDVVNNEIYLEDAIKLTRCVKDLERTKTQDFAVAVLAGTTTQKGSFETLMRPYASNMRIM